MSQTGFCHGPETQCLGLGAKRIGMPVCPTGTPNVKA